MLVVITRTDRRTKRTRDQIKVTDVSNVENNVKTEMGRPLGQRNRQQMDKKISGMETK